MNKPNKTYMEQAREFCKQFVEQNTFIVRDQDMPIIALIVELYDRICQMQGKDEQYKTECLGVEPTPEYHTYLKIQMLHNNGDHGQCGKYSDNAMNKMIDYLKQHKGD